LGGVAKQTTIGVRLGDEAGLANQQNRIVVELIVIITLYGAEDVNNHRLHPLGVVV
jgi:hypothetical protein